MEDASLRAVIRNLVIELGLYAVLVVVYSMVVLRWLGEPLFQLFHSRLPVYALLSLGLIVAQGALLDVVTAFLLDQLPIERLE